MMIVRRVDDLGRVVIPKEIRRVLNIQEGDPLQVEVYSGKVILSKYEVNCVYCGEVIDTETSDTMLCSKCKTILDQNKKVVKI